MKLLRTISIGLASVIILAGCATNKSTDYGSDMVGGQVVPDAEDKHAKVSHDPLLDAPFRAEMTCVSEGPITVISRIKEVSFACQDVGVSAKIDEIRDAGWRVVSMEVGDDIESERHVGFPVTIVVRKLY